MTDRRHSRGKKRDQLLLVRRLGSRASRNASQIRGFPGKNAPLSTVGLEEKMNLVWSKLSLRCLGVLLPIPVRCSGDTRVPGSIILEAKSQGHERERKGELGGRDCG